MISMYQPYSDILQSNAESENSCLIDNGCQSGCTNGGNGTSTSTSTATSLSSGAKIGIITGGAVFGVCLILVGLYMLWRYKRRRQKTLDLDSDLESEVDPIPDPTAAPITAVTPFPDLILNPGMHRVCRGCSQAKSILAAFPRRRITAGCNHEPGLCRQCLERSINVSLAQGGWDHVRCPETRCDSQLEATDIQEFASPEDIQR
jgi:hypothetical protein